MDAKFWMDAWNAGRTGFHLNQFHDKLLEHFPRLAPEKGQWALVPLCGKTKDLLWLQGLGLKVHGVELHESAVKAFFAENRLSPTTSRDEKFVHYSAGEIQISCGDFLKIEARECYDFVYDRASLVALPPGMRADYVRVVAQSLKRGGKYLLVVYTYDPGLLDGPPFSIDTAEVQKLYEDDFAITCIDCQTPKLEGARLASLGDAVKQDVYILEKR
jgi:thiopurine S-methyltransferase